MTSIEFLQISGIRSFSPNNKQQIKFLTPLTIIVGANGSGKTTIIETLKCATTGELPPNSNKGQSFVHDPKVLGSSEVKAQIRLQFRSAGKKQMVVTRSFQVTQKEKKAEFKQLEAALMIKEPNGEVISQSHKCSEMDKLIPECMGVSKAVLENVIFCHQEDVNWPLSDSATLKKKFDDIFASARYTKALDAIRKLKTEQTNQVKDFKGELGVLEERRDQAKKLEKDANAKKETISDLKEKISNLDEQIAKLDEDIVKFDKIAEKIRLANADITKFEALRDSAKKESNDLQKALELEFEEADHELEDMLNQFLSQLQNLTSDKEKLEKLKSQKEKERDTLRTSMTKIETDLTIHERDERDHKNLVMELGLEIQALAKRHKIDGYENPTAIDDRKVLSFVELLETRLKKYKSDLQDLKQSHQREERSSNDTISQLKSKIDSINGSISRNQRTISDKDAQRKRLQNEVQRTSTVSQEAIQQKESELKQLETDLQNLQKSLNLEETTKTISRLQTESKDTNQKIGKANSDMKQREAEKIIALKLKDLREEERKAKESLNSNFASIESKLSSVITEQFTVDQLESTFKKAIAAKRDATSKQNAKVQQIERTISSLKSKIETYNEDVQKFNQQLATLERKIKAAVPEGKDIASLTAESEEIAGELRSDIALYESLSTCYEKYIAHAKKRKECPVCERGLNDSEMSTFIELQESKLKQAPKYLKSKKERLQETEEVLRQLRNLIPVQKDIDRIKTKEIIDVQAKKQKVEEELTSENENLSKESAILATCKEEENRIISMQQDVNDVLRMQQNFRTTGMKISEEEKNLKKANTSNDGRSFEDIRAEYENLQQRSLDISNEIQKLQQESQTKRSEIDAIERKIKSKNGEVQAVKLEFEKKKRVIEQEEQVAKEISTLENENNEYNVRLPALKAELEESNRNLQSIRQNNQSSESEFQETLDILQKDISNISSNVAKIRKYANSNAEEQKQTLIQKKDKLSIQIERIQDNIDEAVKELRVKTDTLDKKGPLRKSIEDNLAFRRKRKQYEKYEADLKAKVEELKKLTGGQQVDISDIESKKKKRSSLAAEKANLQGAKTTKSEDVRKILEDLQDAKYNNIENRYRATLIKLKTAEAANDDLNKYYVALGKALAKYHTMKMDEINQIVKDLWQKTYRGQDIDTIEIRADHEESTTTRRSYNYRVVMKKGDVALDMRGRCSQGQKVLASLIIRLALAEAFCIDCGVLALDEPSANLDHDNASSLADSLQVIIHERKKQSNFQLIVITHDEDFVQKLGRSEFADYYYRISKDPTSQTSTITRQNFAEQ